MLHYEDVILPGELTDGDALMAFELLCSQLIQEESDDAEPQLCLYN